jgi:hypothetical protein
MKHHDAGRRPPGAVGAKDIVPRSRVEVLTPSSDCPLSFHKHSDSSPRSFEARSKPHQYCTYLGVRPDAQ